MKTVTAVLTAAVLLTGCPTPPENPGARLRPHLSPVSLGDMYPLPSGEEADYGSSLKVPYAWALLLQSVGTETVTIDSLCLVGNEDGLFEIEGPDARELGPNQMAAVRITYDSNRISPNGEPDNVALVVQSDAIDFPTLVVPICARTIAEGGTRGQPECTSPAQVAPGERDPGLCAQ